MWSSCFLALACIAPLGEGLLLRDQTAAATLSLEDSGDWAAYAQAETEDRNFLLSQLDDTESELLKLQQFVEMAGRKSNVLAGLQLSATPTAKSSSVPTAKSPVAKKDAAPVAKKETAAAKPAPSAKSDVKKVAATAEMDPAKLVASLGIPSLKLKGKAALAPMLAMLKGLYDDSKSRIASQNTREEKSKKWFTAKEAEHKNKMETIEGKFKNGTLSEEFRTNETRDENRYFGYWSRVRERQHRQFHTNLKIQHAMMSKVKKMIDMYENTLSGKAGDQEKAKKQLVAVSGGMPEIVFLQEVEHTVGRFCRESLAEVRKERAELQQQAHEAME
jgi:glutaredoxin 2